MAMRRAGPAANPASGLAATEDRKRPTAGLSAAACWRQVVILVLPSQSTFQEPRLTVFTSFLHLSGLVSSKPARTLESFSRYLASLEGRHLPCSFSLSEEHSAALAVLELWPPADDEGGEESWQARMANIWTAGGTVTPSPSRVEGLLASRRMLSLIGSVTESPNWTWATALRIPETSLLLQILCSRLTAAAGASLLANQSHANAGVSCFVSTWSSLLAPQSASLPARLACLGTLGSDGFTMWTRTTGRS
mmetsp:Transcript_37233/g.105041  ORF Transcript_37233/g.105041 Transcript_37233/m.105041 type:complete len:250 (+) Transcript_37233:1293-2042(+)